MTDILTELQPGCDSGLRLLSSEEIDLVTGGRRGGALSAVIANALATGASTYTQASTRTYAFTLGNVSVAIGWGFGIAVGVGPGSTATVAIGASASATA